MTPADRERSDARTRLGRRRLQADLSQRELAERAGIPLRTLQRLEREEVADPGVRLLLACAEVLDCTIDDLIEEEWRRAGPTR